MTDNPAPDNPGPLVAYRWFQVLDDGILAGARNVAWPPGEPLHAEHVTTSVFAERPDGAGPVPLTSVVWAALRPAEQVAGAIVVSGLAVAVAAPAGRVAMAVAAASAVALWWQVFYRHRALNDAVLRICAVLLGLFAVALAVTGVWLLVLLAWTAQTDGWADHRVAAAGAAAVACAAMAAAVVALGAMFARPRPPRHDCPVPPRRLIARWAPECGIYAYRTLPAAAQAATREHLADRQVLIARVMLWGRLFPYSDGFRSEWARIDTLFDDGSGHVEIPAARYRTDVEAWPAAVTAPAADRTPRPKTSGSRLRAWAERRQAENR